VTPGTYIDHQACNLKSLRRAVSNQDGSAETDAGGNGLGPGPVADDGRSCLVLLRAYGYGFITRPAGPDVLVHYAKDDGYGFRLLEEN
jgi:hypothetical protein